MVTRKDGRYQTKILLPDGTYKYFTGKTEAAVIRNAALWQAEQELGKRFEDVADEWWEYIIPRIGHHTSVSYHSAYERAKEHFDGYIKDIKTVDVSRFLFQFSREGVAEKTVKNQLMVVSQILSFGVNCGYIEFNPAKEAEMPRNLPKKKRHGALDKDIEKIKQHADEEMGFFGLMAYCLGARRSELLALEWEDVDFKNKVVHITKSLARDKNGKLSTKSPKTQAGFRSIPIPDTLYPILQLKKGSGLVFPSPTGNYMSESTFAEHWGKFTESYGISCTPHELRHSYATVLYTADVPPENARILLGHEDYNLTLSVYADISEEKRKAMKNVIANVNF